MRIQQFLFLTISLFGSIALFGSMHDSQTRTDELQKGKGLRFAQGAERLRQQQQKAQAEKEETSEQYKEYNPYLFDRPWYKQITGPVIKFYAALTLFGFANGIINNYLSKGAPNKHFFKAPLRESYVGLGFHILTYLSFTFNKFPGNLSSLNPTFTNRIISKLLVGASWGGGQALGEMLPLNHGFWRNFATNHMLVGIPELLTLFIH